MNVLTFSLFCALAVTASGNPSTRIVGGSDAGINELPWFGSLQIHSGDNWFHFCGIVLYAPNKGLTAAHCLVNNFDAYRVVFGIRNIVNGGASEQASNITSYIVHPDYNHNLAGFPNDTAVVRFATAMDTTGAAVKTISLASDTSAEVDGSSCLIAGWGRTSFGGAVPEILQKVNVTLISNTQCSSLWTAANVTGAAIIDSVHLCTYENGNAITICSGDKGGPLVCGNTVVGLVSWELSACSGAAPTVYARVSQAYNWIVAQ